MITGWEEPTEELCIFCIHDGFVISVVAQEVGLRMREEEERRVERDESSVCDKYLFVV